MESTFLPRVAKKDPVLTRFAHGAGPSESKDPERKKLFNAFDKKSNDDQDMEEEEEKQAKQEKE